MKGKIIDINPDRVPPYYLTKEENSWRDGFSWCEWARHGKQAQEKEAAAGKIERSDEYDQVRQP